MAKPVNADPVTLARLSHQYARLADTIGDADTQNSRMVQLLSSIDALRVLAIEAIQAGEPGRAVALLLDQAGVIEEAHAEENGDIATARELRDLLRIIRRTLKGARNRVRTYRIARSHLEASRAAVLAWRERVVPAAPAAHGAPALVADAEPALMDAQRIDELASLSPIWGDPDEGREFTAADLGWAEPVEFQAQQEAAPGGTPNAA